MALRNGCQLITYPDSLGSDLRELERLLSAHFADALVGIHLLPFYPSSGDRGFAPLTYEEVDPAFGSWSDVERLGEHWDLIADFMVNHISRRSPWFEDYLRHGETSPYADLFIRVSRLGVDRAALEAALAKIFKRKPAPPLLDVELADGTRDQVWCTFSDEQIDLNTQSQAGRAALRAMLEGLTCRGLKMLRLDAFAYAVKRLGTSCFFVEPETSELLEEIASLAAARGIEVLPEIHERHELQLKLAAQGYWVYDFNLPLLVLQAFYDASSRSLAGWLRICPRKQITTLDTHDGLPVLDVEGLLGPDEIERTKANLFAQGANVQRYSVDPAYRNRNVYQLNCSYYSALGEDDEAYLAARAIQFFAPGIPQVYYVGLLAGRNDVDLVERTKYGRNINRHNYSLAEAERELERPVVQRLRDLMRFRNSCPAFAGGFELEASAEHELIIRRRHGAEEAVLQVDLRSRRARIHLDGPQGRVDHAL